MAIDFRKNKDSLEKAFRQITDDKDSTNWVIYGYEGQTNVLKVVETGGDGIDEVAEELNSGRMQYAYCRVKDPNTALDKYVLIQWTGESVPENIKLKYTTHLRDMQAFVKTVHVTVAARSETDIDEADIVKKVSKASGANYSFHKEKAKPEEAPAPVGTDYKRVRPDREINLNERDKFWNQTEKDEISRQKDNKSKMDEERKKIEDQRKEREQREAEERDKLVAERMKEVGVQKAAEHKSEQKLDREEEKKKWAQVQKESSIDEEERGHRSDQLRKERVAEASHLVSSSASKSRDFFKQKSMERPEMANRAPPPPRKVIRGFGQQEQQDPVRKEPIELPKEDNPAPISPEPAAPKEPEPIQEPEPEPIQEPEPEPIQEPEPEPTQEVASPPESSPHTRNLLKESLPPQRHHSDSEEEQAQDWNETPEQDSTPRDNRVPSVHESSEDYHPDHQSQQLSYQDNVEEEPKPEESSPAANEGSADHGLCARALYDYQAADDTEITFDPDDIITNIEQIDEGWWQGFGPDGAYGMFPSNYVELMS